MVTGCVEARPSGDSAESPSVPPGFSPLLSFKLEKVQDMDAKTCVGFSPPAVPQAGRNVDACSKGPEDKLRKSLRQRPTINYNEVDGSSEEDSDSEMLDHVVSSINTLKKGVIHGCSTCENCQRVLARWQPSNSRRPILEEAPVFYPTEEEFQDTMKYIGSIRERAESYGICRIVPPPSWKPPCPLKEENIWKTSKFATRIQRIHRLQNRPTLRQSSRYQSMSRKKRRRLLKQGIGHRDIDECSLETSYPTYCADNLEFGPGPHFTLESFSKYADDFSVQYFRSEEESQSERKLWSPPSVEEIEGEYWRIVEKPTEEIEVLYGADLETGEFCSGFPKTLDKNDANTKYVNSGWNLNNLPRLPGSVLSFESADISGVLVPWLYVGMCFSSFCWHVEDHHLYSLNYMHWGAPKMWYGVPGGDAVKLEEAMKKHLPELFEEQHDLLHKLVTQFSPSILISEGVPVYRCVQNAGEFVLTFPRGYHSGFNCGFNCAEAVNVAPFDWLPHGQIAVELYHHQCRKITISHDKLLIGAARQAVRAQWELSFLKKTTSDSLLWKNVCGSDNVLAKALKARLEVERHRRAQFCTASQCRKMDTNFDTSGDKECFICHFDLYLSATGCVCSPDKYACLCHTEQLCSCERSMRVFLFRYEIGEINILVDALGGKLSAIHKWGNTDLGLSLTSVVAQRKAQERSSVDQSSMGGKVLVKPNNGGCYGASQHNKEFCIDNEKQNQYRGEATLCKPDVSSCEKGQEVFIHDVKVDPLSCKPRVSSSEKVSVDPGLVKKVPEALNKIGNTFNRESSMLQNSAFESNLKENFALESSLCDENLLSAEPSFKNCDNNMKSETQGDSFLSISDSRSRMVKFPETFIQIRTLDNKATTCNHQDKILSIPETSASVMEENGSCSLHNVEDMGFQSSYSNTQEKAKGEMLAESMPFAVDRQKAQKNILNVFVGTSNAKAVQDPVVSNQIDIVNGSINRCKVDNSAPLKTATEDAKVLSDYVIRTIDGQSITDNSPCSSNSVEGASLQRGPRMAKVVRRFNCSVEPLQFGMVLSGKLWSTSQVIYPKGYRSRVRYFSIRDPAQMCYYVSEILDGGPYGPLFMVQVEHCPSDVFIHLSPTKCWDMVRERINSEIKWQHAHGKPNVPCLQPPGSVDGLGMFGLSSPSVIQAIESLDQYHICSEYWKSRNPGRTMADLDSAPYPNLGSGAGILRNLFNKADSEELSLLQMVLSDDRSSFHREVINLLHEHRQKLPESTDCT